MKIVYTGNPEGLGPKQRAKLEAKLAKVTKSMERKGEKEAHIILSQVRHLHKVEITLNAFDHSLAGAGLGADLAVAMGAAIEKLDKQIVKMMTKWRDSHRHDSIKTSQPEAETQAPPAAKTPVKKKALKAASDQAETPARVKVYRVDHSDGKKPMTLEEAMLEMGTSQDYFVYRDATTDRVCTLLRRNDGHLDLVES